MFSIKRRMLFWIFDNLVEIHVYFLDSADERSNMGSPKILIFGERRKCCDLNSRASSLSQATDDEAVAIDFGDEEAPEWMFDSERLT